MKRARLSFKARRTLRIHYEAKLSLSVVEVKKPHSYLSPPMKESRACPRYWPHHQF